MLAMEELLCEMGREERGLPPGFRFHPTDEELITFYLASKVFNGSFCGVQIAQLDLNRCEPWDLPDVAKMGEREWYFFSSRDRKYPTGLRTNRATCAGYWKATGKDRQVNSASTGALLGMKKTLVFYRGRAPRGDKTNWVMHEYRLDGDFSYRHTCKEEWVICRIFHKAGEKKNGVVMQGQGFLLEDSPKHNPNCFPQLLEGQSKTSMELEDSPKHNPNCFPQLLEGQSKTSMELDFEDATNLLMNHLQDHDLKCLIMNPALPTTNRHHETESDLLPNNETTATHTNKQCKLEASFPELQLPDGNNSLSMLSNYRIQANPYDNNPLFYEMDCEALAGQAPPAHDSFGFISNAGFQMYPLRVGPDYWPLDHIL